MFDKRKDSTEPENPAVNSPTTTPPSEKSFNPRSTAVIGKTIKVKGSISGNENLVIEGTVDGSVDLPQNDLTVGEAGQVIANLEAKTVKVDGQVTGDISGSEKVVISKSGRVQGNIVAPRVTLEDGAKFKGSIDMDPGNDSASTSPKPAVSAKSAPPSAPRDKAIGESGS
ncbi:MAG: polymer-forming cytoskeletal protein [bacterium]